MDAAGNVWFAEPGCDFAPTCSSTTPPGQLGELPAGLSTPKFWTLPNISGNQPMFVALDGAGNVWFTTPNNSMIGEFSPASQSFVGQWPVTPGSGPWDLTFNQGILWYTEHLVSAIGEFDPVAHTHIDFQTPSANSNPYGITANDPANPNLIWFTENNSSVARIGVLDTGHGNEISEYLIRAQPPGGAGLTPHMISLVGQGNPWWTEGWVRAIGTLAAAQATAGQCGASTGDCVGVSEHNLPPPPSSCNSTHVSGLAVQGGSSSRIWFDDSLSSQVGSYNPATGQFALANLSNCNAHPHDGLNLDSALQVWWDEEFNNALGELTQ
jgi:streptogramin lyase